MKKAEVYLHVCIGECVVSILHLILEARLVFITHEHFASLGLLLYLQCFRLSFHFVVSLAAVFPLWGGALRDETKLRERDFALNE